MRVEESIVIDASPEEIWDVITEPDNVREVIAGVTRWDVEGEQRTGPGARYALRMRVGSAEVGGLVEVVEWSPPGDMAWTSITGVDHRGRWRLRRREDGCTKVTLRLAYQAPGGILGTLADRLSSPRVSANLCQTMENLKHRMEGTDPLDDDGGPSAGDIASTVGDAAFAVQVFARAGLVRPERPDRMLRAARDFLRWGATPAAGYAAGADRHPHRPAIIDELGMLTFADVHRRTNRLASALSDAGVLEGDGVAIMCRNHRYFVESIVALSKLGAHALLLNTSFAGPQLTEVVKREKPRALIYDDEFAELLSGAGRRRKRFVAWTDADEAADPTLEDLIAAGDEAEVIPPAEPGRTVILTSGTTGTPKGASRGSPGVSAAVSILSEIPLRARERTLIAAPLFHSWGFAHLSLALVLSSTIVLQRRFDPAATLQGVERHGATTVPMVPVMLQRVLELPDEQRTGPDLSTLRVVPVSGSALPGDLSDRFMNVFGEVLYNLYGSTEVAWATIATPRDLREAPGTAGRPPRGTVLRIYGEDDQELPVGQTGRIFVGNDMLFEGYTGGGGKDVIDGLMATGDVGHLDEEGRLFVEGRDDDMIVSGGENVFPQEVEDLLARHEKVREAAVIGVPDDEWGQRLKAFVVGSGLSENDVKKLVKDNLARFKVPREVEFIDELPRNATGKVLKRELAERENG